jgi:hypothetical protein
LVLRQQKPTETNMRSDLVLEITDACGVITDTLLGDTLAPRFNWKPGHSARVQARKLLENLTNLGKITKHEGFYRSLNCRSEFSEHSRKVSQCITELYKLPYQLSIKREFSFSNGLRSDAVIVLTQQDSAACVILEVCNTETDSYFSAKVRELKRNSELIKKELSQYFQYEIPSFTIVAEGKSGVMSFQQLLTILRRENGSDPV